jgi:hypothetical protein
MSIRDRIFQLVIGILLKRPARKQSYDTLIAALEASGQRLLTQFDTKADTQRNREQLRHIIGIERWGQRRLQSMLGAPLLNEEYDQYQPDANLDFAALRRSFQETRQESVLMARRIQAQGISKATPVRHNQFGDLPIDAWLRYLTTHAAIESKRIR